MSSIIYNDKLFSEDETFLGTNRAFKYGDACFETIRIMDGQPIFLQDHLTRIKGTLSFLQIEEPASLSLQELGKSISKLVRINKIEKGGKARLTIWRSGGGLFYPHSKKSEYTVECQSVECAGFKLNDKGLKVDVYTALSINPAPLSNYKTTNCLPYVLAAKWAKDNNFDDAIMQDLEGGLAEATSSNLFLLLDGKVVTPHLKRGGLLGTMRNRVITMAKAANLKVEERKVTVKDLEQADEMFFTNAISGVKWVGAFRKTRYYHRLSSQIIAELNQSISVSSN